MHICLTGWLCSHGGGADGEARALSPKQQSIVTISPFTAKGDLEKLKTVLDDGLNAGLTVNEIKEILLQSGSRMPQ